MSRIVRAEVLTDSSSDSFNRVKLKSPGIWNESQLIESVNGIFLRKGEIVFVSLEDNFQSPLIIGRACNWLNAEELTSLVNNLIDSINKLGDEIDANSSKFNSHTHNCSALIPTVGGVPGTIVGFTLAPNMSMSDVSTISNIDVDDVIHKD